MDIIETSLQEIINPFTKNISNLMIRLTQSEIHIATMIKQGFTNKEIAQALNCSKRTIDTHRANIRKKLNLTNQKVNLKSSVLNTSELIRTELPVESKVIVEENSNTTIATEVINPYILVGGSFQYFENASQMQHELSSEGYASEIIEMETGLYRVIIDSYKNKDEVTNAKITYRMNHKGSEAWVSIR